MKKLFSEVPCLKGERVVLKALCPTPSQNAISYNTVDIEIQEKQYGEYGQTTES